MTGSAFERIGREGQRKKFRDSICVIIDSQNVGSFRVWVKVSNSNNSCVTSDLHVPPLDSIV